MYYRLYYFVPAEGGDDTAEVSAVRVHNAYPTGQYGADFINLHCVWKKETTMFFVISSIKLGQFR